METVQVEVWVLVDSEGHYVASDDEAHLVERYDAEVGEDRDTIELRRVKVLLTVPKPVLAVLTGTVAPLAPAGDLTAV